MPDRLGDHVALFLCAELANITGELSRDVGCSQPPAEHRQQLVRVDVGGLDSPEIGIVVIVIGELFGLIPCDLKYLHQHKPTEISGQAPSGKTNPLNSRSRIKSQVLRIRRSNRVGFVFCPQII